MRVICVYSKQHKIFVGIKVLGINVGNREALDTSYIITYIKFVCY